MRFSYERNDFYFCRPDGAGSRDAWHAACTEKLALLFLITPLVIGAPYLLAQWDRFKRADNARRRAAQKRRMERMVQR